MKEIYWIIIGMIALNILAWGMVRLHNKEVKKWEEIIQKLDEVKMKLPAK